MCRWLGDKLSWHQLATFIYVMPLQTLLPRIAPSSRLGKSDIVVERGKTSWNSPGTQQLCPVHVLDGYQLFHYRHF